MRRTFYFMPILILLLILESCSTVKISSNKQVGYNKITKKIFIVVSCDKSSTMFCSGLVKGLKNKLTEKGIASDSFLRDPLSLETEADVDRKVVACGAETILTIQQTVTGNAGDTFELTLIDRETKKHVWKGELEVSAGTYSSIADPEAINKAIKALTNQLIQDKII